MDVGLLCLGIRTIDVLFRCGGKSIIFKSRNATLKNLRATQMPNFFYKAVGYKPLGLGDLSEFIWKMEFLNSSMVKESIRK